MKGFVILLYERGNFRLAGENGETLVFTDRAELAKWIRCRPDRWFRGRLVDLSKLRKEVPT